MENRHAAAVKTAGAPSSPQEKADDGMTILEKLLNGMISSFLYARSLASIFFNFWIALFLLRGSRWNYTKRTISHQIIFSGIDALWLIGLIAAIVGGVIMVQMLAYSPDFQTDAFLMQIMVSLTIKELAPILTALILVGRSGSAITIELGEMNLKRHPEALESMGIDLFQYFHVPRIIGLSVSNVMLNAYFVIITLASALAISALQGDVDMATMLTLFVDSVKLSDVTVCIIKGALLGITIALVCLHHGMAVKSSATQIPQQTSQAIVNSFRLSYTFNGIISVIWYLTL